MIRYRIEVADPHAHLYRVTLSVPQAAPEQRLSLPVWIPGSYMVREFGRHLSRLEARQGAKAVPLEQIDKTTWLARAAGRGALVVSCEVYAFDASVRTAFLDAGRGFFNATSLCLRVEGQEHEPHAITLGTLPRGWDIATAMRRTAPREFVAADYDELVDHPFELGRFWRGSFTAAGVAHEFVVAGAWPGFDGERLLADTRRICETQIAFWHGPRGRPPYERYVFMLAAVEDGYGGLEHRASTALIAARRDLPRVGQKGSPGDGYVTLLGLISHEFFHTWNVKRLKPVQLARIDYTRENYTSLLWFFEGFTSYYDDLLLVRAGLIDEARYFKLLAKTLAGVLATPGRHVQSVAQASFDAWVKYYRGDENTPNATVSYYTKGSLVALAFDLTLRAAGRGTLDDVMRGLWQRSAGGPIDETLIADVLREVGGRSFARELGAWVHGRDDLPLEALLDKAGIVLRPDKPGLAASLGLRVSEGPLTGVQVRSVLRGGAAERAGLSAGDELLAIDGWRMRRLDDALQWTAPGQPFELLLARDQRLHTLTIEPGAAGVGTLSLQASDKPTKAAANLRREWLAPGALTPDPMAPAPPTPKSRRRAAWVLLVLCVAAGHGVITWRLADGIVGWGQGERPKTQRMEVAFVRELAPQAPPIVAPTPPAAPPRQRRRAAVAAASAPAASAALPEPPQPQPQPVQPPVAALPQPPDLPPAAAVPADPPPQPDPPTEVPSAAAVPEPAASAAAAFEWPPSTRLSYLLTGNYRGEVHGRAQVQWVRRGSRYQVHLDVHVGPGFAPLFSRRMTSDGDLTEQGLVPKLYDEETKALFGTPRRVTMRFEPERIVLANGSQRPPVPGVQDTASQFVQLTWLFTMQPQRLYAGATVAWPLALPRRVDTWTYEVVAEETLFTPIGELATFHVKPRRESPRPGELVAEMWIAPGLQYLPVRIRIRQDAENFVDLLIESRPLQAE